MGCFLSKLSGVIVCSAADVNPFNADPVKDTLPYWCNPAFLIVDIRALRTECQSTRMSEIENDGLDQYGAERFEQQQFGTADVEGVNVASVTDCRR